MFSQIIKTYLAIPNGDKYSSKFAYPNDLRSDKKKRKKWQSNVGCFVEVAI